MTRRNGVIKAIAAVVAGLLGTRVVAQETFTSEGFKDYKALGRDSPSTGSASIPTFGPVKMLLSLNNTLGIEISLNGETITLTPTEIMAALREK